MAIINTFGNLVLLDDFLTEKTDGQYIDFTLTEPDGTLIDTDSIVGILGSFRSHDQNTTIFVNEDMLDTDRVTYPEAGKIRVTFKVTDLDGIGGLEKQRRELTLTITHSIDKKLVIAVRFSLLCLQDI